MDKDTQAAFRLHVAEQAADYMDELVAAIEKTATELAQFTTADVWDRCSPETRANIEARFMGAAMRRAKAMGLCFTSQEWRTSNQRVSHRRPMRVWISKLHGEEE